jgi:hypothetical protein
MQHLNEILHILVEIIPTGAGLSTPSSGGLAPNY